MLKDKLKTQEQRFIKDFERDLMDSDLKFGQYWHTCKEEGREHCIDFHIEGCPCIYCSPNCPRHRHRVDREASTFCINCSKKCTKIQGINRIKCAVCDTAWCYICNSTVSSQISYSFKHFFLLGYNEVVPDLCPLHDSDNLTGYECEECDEVLKDMDDSTDQFYDDGNDYFCKRCDSKFEWPCEASQHIKEHTNGKCIIFLKVVVSEDYYFLNEKTNVKNAKNIRDLIMSMSNVLGVSEVSGKDSFFTPPWTFQIVLKSGDIPENQFLRECFPPFVLSVDIISDKWDHISKSTFKINPWNYERTPLLINSPLAKQFPVKQWLTDPCHLPQFRITSQNIECVQCQQVIHDFPDILRNRIKVDTMTVFKCKRYKRYYCGCKAGDSFTGQPLLKYGANSEQHKAWPNIHCGERCYLEFGHACDLLKHNKDHSLQFEGRGLVRICIPNKGEIGEYNEKHEQFQERKEILKSDPNILLIGPKYGYDCPSIYWDRGDCIDLIVKEKVNVKRYILDNLATFFLNSNQDYYSEYFPLGAYLCDEMILNCIKNKVMLYEHFQTEYEVPKEYQQVSVETVKYHLVKNSLRKIKLAKNKGLWCFDDINGKCILNGGSVPEIEIDGYNVTESISDKDSDGISESNMSSNQEDSDECFN